jgi:hypothetical protein
MGTALADLRPVASMDSWQDALTFVAVAGVRYQFAVGSSREMAVNLGLRLVPQPVNQSFDGRINLGTGTVQAHGAFGGSTNRWLDPIDDTTTGWVC